MATVCLKVWNVSYGTRCIEVAAEDQYEAGRIALDYWGLGIGSVLVERFRVNKVDRTIVVEVK